MERDIKWNDATSYGRETIQGFAENALALPEEILRQYRDIADSFATLTEGILLLWPEILAKSQLAQTVWDKLGSLQQRLFWKSRGQIVSNNVPFHVRFDSTVSEEGKVAIFEPEIQNCGDGPLFQKINEYGRDGKINSVSLLDRIQKYLINKGPVVVTRSEDKMAFYWPSIKTVALALKTLGMEAVPLRLDDLEITDNGVFWTPVITKEAPENLLASPSWYEIRNQAIRVKTVYNQLGTAAIFNPNKQEENLFCAYCSDRVDIFPTPNPLIASKAFLAMMWDTGTENVISEIKSPLGWRDQVQQALTTMRKYTPVSFLGANNYSNASDFVPAVAKPIFGAQQKGVSVVDTTSKLDGYERSSDFIIQKWVAPYKWTVPTSKGRRDFNTRLEAFCWFENGRGEVLDFLATGSIKDIVGGNREGPMTTVFFK